MMRESRIRCKSCNKGLLYWKPVEKRYVCIECGLESEALPTWEASAQHRKSKAEKQKEKHIAFIQEILGTSEPDRREKRKKKRPSRAERLEEEWNEMIENSKKHG